jgi:hypothetical protein
MSTKSANYPKTIVVPIEGDMWRTLRKIAFEQETTMNQLVRKAVKDFLAKWPNDKVDNKEL